LSYRGMDDVLQLNYQSAPLLFYHESLVY